MHVFNTQLDAEVAVDHIPLGMTREDFQSVCVLKKHHGTSLLQWVLQLQWVLMNVGQSKGF